MVEKSSDSMTQEEYVKLYKEKTEQQRKYAEEQSKKLWKDLDEYKQKTRHFDPVSLTLMSHSDYKDIEKPIIY